MSRGRKIEKKKEKDYSPNKRKIIKRKFTTIRLILIKNKKNTQKDYFYMKFSDSSRISLEGLIRDKIQSIKLEIKSKKIILLDKVELESKDGKNKVCFILPIYVNKNNTYYINLKPNKKGYFFECIYYSKKSTKLPKNILYKSNNQKLDEFDSYGLNFRKKINIINSEMDIANDYIENLSPDSNSYKICIRINDKGEMISSIHKLDSAEKSNQKSSSKVPKLQSNKGDIKKIFQLFDDFKKMNL